MTQKERLKELVISFCNEQHRRTFSLQELNRKYGDYSNIGIGGNTPSATVRRLLQELRDESFLSFLDKSGHYTLRGIELLNSEEEDLKSITINDEDPQKIEHLREIYIRNNRLVREAKSKFDYACLISRCQNTFLMPGEIRYIEVHHIVPLCEDGEDALWNLATVCAHHHKMAHFATADTRRDIQNYLLETNHRLLG